MKKVVGASVVAMVAMLAAPVAAEDYQRNGFYIGAHGGYIIPDNAHFDGARIQSRYKDGYAYGGYVGYETGPWRTEVEYTHRDINANYVSAVGFGTDMTGRGEANSDALMGNVYYVFNHKGRLKPYVGGGIGIGWLDYNNVRVNSNVVVNDKGSDVAYQGIVGVSYDLSEAVRTDLNYRYWTTGKVTMATANGPGEVRQGQHGLFLGLTVSLGKHYERPMPTEAAYTPPPPPPPPPPAPVPEPEPVVIPGPFMVFFDFDSTDLDPIASQVISEAVDAYRAFGIARIEAVGHTDRSGSDDYNQALSERRADAVRAALEAAGVESDKIATDARGEADNRVPTPDGERHPQNRRVEITLGE